MPLARHFAGLLFAVASSFAAAQTVQNAAGGSSPTVQQSSKDSSYLLGSEDTITITVIKHPEFSGDFLIPQSGDIQVPAVGSLHVEGLSLADVTRLITSSLAANRLWKPEVTVTLKIARLRRVYVVGDVKLSGAYDWKPGWTVAQLLSASGGLNPDIQQNDVKVVLEHAGGGVGVAMPLADALRRSDDPSLSISPGDTLRVESILTLPVYVTGHVVKPGLYRLRNDSANPLAAISEAGGALPDASLNVRVQHVNGKEETLDLAPALVLGKKVDLPQLLGGDMVIVSESQNRFTVLGYVAKPGTYPIPDGHVFHLTDAVATAADTSGPGAQADKKGRISRIGIVRMVEGKPTHKVYDLSKFLRRGDISQNPVINSGDVIYVPQSNGIELTTSLAAISTGAILYYNFRH